MAETTKSAIYGWIRENYNDTFLHDISDIIHQFYLIIMDSKILTITEQSTLIDLLFGELKKQKGNEDIQWIDTSLLFRGSEHNFNASTFHEICDNQGATFVVYHNEYNHVFGGYTSKSWNVNNRFGDDTNTFIWMIRPNAKIYNLKKANALGSCVIWNGAGYGPSFGAPDIWTSIDDSGVGSYIYLFDPYEISGADTDSNDENTFDMKEYEVFKISLHKGE